MVHNASKRKKHRLFLLKATQDNVLTLLNFVSNNISLYHDTSEATYRYVYKLYHCNSNDYTQVDESGLTIVSQKIRRIFKNIISVSPNFGV